PRRSARRGAPAPSLRGRPPPSGHKPLFEKDFVCDAQVVMSEPVTPPEQGNIPGLAEMARVVARQRAELDRLHEQAATAAVVERAKGVVMALTGCSAEAAGDTLLRRSVTAGHSLLEECLLTLGASERSAPRSPEETPAAPEARPAAGTPGDGSDDGLGRLALALAHALTPQDVARGVLDPLSAGQGADPVVLYARRAHRRPPLIGPGAPAPRR